MSTIDFITNYASLRADDDHLAQWETADVARMIFQETGNADDWEKINPVDEDHRITADSGASLTVALEHDEDGTVDGITVTWYDVDGDETSTDGRPLETERELAEFITDLIVDFERI